MSKMNNSLKYITLLSSAMGTVLGLSACGNLYTPKDMRDNFRNTTSYDRSMDLERNDYRKTLAPRSIDEELQQDYGTPLEFQPVVADAKQEELPMPLVSLSVNQTIALRDIFYELAEQAEVDLELDPNIEGSVIFTAREKPFDEVVRRICDLAGLRYEFHNGMLRIEEDTPYMKTYPINYINLSRTTTTGVSSDSSVDTGEGSTTGSNFSVTGESNADFWGEISSNIEYILRSTDDDNKRVRSTDDITIMQTAIPAVRVSDLSGSATEEVQVNAQQQAQPDPNAAAAPTANATPELTVAQRYSVNRQAGLLSVYANQRQQRLIQDYLEDVIKRVSKQVLVEAKVLEVELTDEFSSGVNWETLFSNSFSINADFGSIPLNPTEGSAISVGLTKGDFTFATDFVQRFGTVRTVSSPRITIMNNQLGTLNVSESRVFFDIEVTREAATDTSPAITTIESEAHNVPEGLIINMLPAVNIDTNEITMTLRPTLTRVVGTVLDPAAAIYSVDANIPEIATQELDSLVRMKSGEIIVLGGLMQEGNTVDETGIPVLGDIPMLGYLFKAHGDKTSKKELVVLLKATVLDDNNKSLTQYDKDLYKKYGGERRLFGIK